MTQEVEIPGHVSAKTLGSILGVSDRQVRRYAEAGDIPAPVNGLYNLAGCVQALISKANSKTATEADAARAALTRERAESLALTNAKKRGDLVPVTEANLAIDMVLAEVKGRLLGLPAAFTRDFETRRKLTKHVEGILNGTADALQKAARQLEAAK